MRLIPSMVDMKRDAEEKEHIADKMVGNMPDIPDYPYGLSICLCNDELEKLGLETDEVEVGDMLHLHCMAKVTSVSQNANEQNGKQRRVELQITHIAAEDEDEENEEYQEKESVKKTSFKEMKNKFFKNG